MRNIAWAECHGPWRFSCLAKNGLIENHHDLMQTHTSFSNTIQTLYHLESDYVTIHNYAQDTLCA